MLNPKVETRSHLTTTQIAEQVDTLMNIENVKGTHGDDTITGDGECEPA